MGFFVDVNPAPRPLLAPSSASRLVATCRGLQAQPTARPLHNTGRPNVLGVLFICKRDEASQHPLKSRSGARAYRTSLCRVMPRIRAKQTRTSRASKSKKFKSTDDGLYTIKGILDERVVKVAVKERGKGTEKIEDQIQYLVDWEDHKVTGEKYPPNWTPVRLKVPFLALLLLY